LSKKNGICRNLSFFKKGHTPHKVLDGTAIRVSHYNPEQKLRLALTVQPPHMAEEEQLVVDWARSQGLTVTNRYANRMRWMSKRRPP
jgi:hypothetical protein